MPTIYLRIRGHTQQAFGQAINPHIFRDGAATTLAIADPAHVRVAAPLLGHRTFTTTERHYQQAKSSTRIAPTSPRSKTKRSGREAIKTEIELIVLHEEVAKSNDATPTGRTASLPTG